MVNIISRLSWVFAIVAFIAIFSVDDDLFVFALVVAIIIKALFNKNYIENEIDKFRSSVTNEILSQIIDSWFDKKSVEKIKEIVNNKKDITNNETVVNDNSLSVLLNEEDTKQGEENELSSIYEEIQKENYNIKENKKEEIDSYEEEKEKEPWKIEKFLTDFFAENVMAKIGGILLALWVIFLMTLIYSKVWPVAKIIIWFFIGFSVYITWIILKNRWNESESMILLWTWILINYIVILTGKFVIWEPWVDWYLSSSITFIFLVLNTLFSIVTAYINKSNNLLLFSIIFSYVIPFITWTWFSNLELITYSIILSLWGFSISNYFYNNDDKNSALQLIFVSLFGWNMLLLLASLDNTADFTYKMIWFNIINFISLFLLYKNKFEKSIISSFILSYVFLWILMISGHSLNWISILITFVIATLWLLIINSYFIIAGIVSWLLYFLFFPLVFVLGFLFLWWEVSWFILLPFFLVVYLIIFSLLATGSIIWSFFRYIFFAFLWWFLIIWNSYLNVKIWLDNNTFWSIFVTSFIFLFSSYYMSWKKELHYLYTLWTVASIFLFLPIIQIKWDFVNFSILAISIFWLTNYLLPFVNKNLVKNDTQNLVLWSIFWVIFIWLNLYRYWSEYFPWVSMWLWFLSLAILYFIWWYILFSFIDFKSSEKSESDFNFIYTFLWIAVSLFSISIALIFAKMPAIIAMIWLFQSSIVLYFANKLWKEKIYVAWIILFIVWLAKYGHYFWYLLNDLYRQISYSSTWEVLKNWWFKLINYFNHLVWTIFIGISIFANLAIFKNSKFKTYYTINVLHLIWVFILGLNIMYLFTDLIANHILYWKHSWISFVIVSLILISLSIIYNVIWNKFVKWTLILSTWFTMLAHIGIAHEFRNYYFNYIVTIIILIMYYIDYTLIASGKIQKYSTIFKVFSFILSIYMFVITSVYLYELTDNYFVLTIYWWILSLIFVHIWLFNENKAFRTIWIYVLIITLIKIIFYDIWNGIDNWIVRVIAFMLVWWIMIYISSIYKSMWFKIKDDLNFTFNEKIWYDNEVSKNDTSKITTNNDIENKESLINKDLDKIDLWDKKSITFSFNDWKKIKIRAKNLIKMWLIVTSRAWKNTFNKWELKTTFDYIKKNYKSELSKNDYEKIIWIIENFIEIWGSVEIE